MSNLGVNMRHVRILTAIAVVLGLSFFGSGMAFAAPSDEVTQDGFGPLSDVETQIVLRTVRMPDAIDTYMLALDAGPQLIDRQHPVAEFWDADVWIVGLRDWSDTAWLAGSPLHGLFASELHAVETDARFKSFEWNAGAGRQLDLHFVNLSEAAALGEACLAQTLYRLSQFVVAKRRAEATERLHGRAHPNARALIVAEEHQLCP